MNVQIVPAYEPLLAALPSGREFYHPQPWKPPSLDESTLARSRAPPEPLREDDDEEDDDDDDDGGDDSDFVNTSDSINAPGAYPGDRSQPP